MLTNEQIAAMSKEELISVDFRELWPNLQHMYDDLKSREAHTRIVSMFDGTVNEWAGAFRKGYDSKSDMGELVSAFSKEPALIKLMTWSRMTSQGINQIDFAKFVHKHLADIIVFDVFGCYRDGKPLR